MDEDLPLSAADDSVARALLRAHLGTKRLSRDIASRAGILSGCEHRFGGRASQAMVAMQVPFTHRGNNHAYFRSCFLDSIAASYEAVWTNAWICVVSMVFLYVSCSVSLSVVLALFVLAHAARVGTQVADLSYINFFLATFTWLHVMENNILHVHFSALSLSAYDYGSFVCRQKALRSLLRGAIELLWNCVDILNWLASVCHYSVSTSSFPPKRL